MKDGYPGIRAALSARLNHKQREGRRSRGFTLIEMLVVVGILIVLLGIGAIAVPSYLRTTAQFERDGIAKELFVAAQNHLSLTYGEGYAGRTGFGTPEDSEEPEGVCYFVVDDDRADYDDEDSVLSLILPARSLDAVVRDGGSYVIRYYKSTGTMMDVFYAEGGSARFPHVFSADEYDGLMSGYAGSAKKAARRSYGTKKAVIGYYGGVESDTLAGPEPISDTPSLRVVNAEQLSAVIEPVFPEDELVLKVYGVESGAEKEFTLSGESSYTVVLDDVTADGGHFIEVCGDDFIPGENIRVSVSESHDDGDFTVVMESPSVRTNSLFDSEYTNADEDEVATIANLRHLENLDEEVSGFNGTLGGVKLLENAEQVNDLSWSGFWTGKSIKTLDGGSTETDCFKPVSTVRSLYYEGGKHSVSDITVDYDGDAGLFGTLPGGSVQNLTLLNFDVSSDGGSAGALLGCSTGDIDLYGILAYNDTGASASDDGYEISAPDGNAGGLAGSLESGGTIKACAAALYVKAGESAGGLVGYALSLTDLNSSYAGGHTVNARYSRSLTGETGETRVNVQGAAAAGGLVGKLEGASTGAGSKVRFSYSTASVATAAGGIAGGLVGDLSNTAVSDSYSVGLVSSDAGSKLGTYVGKGTDVSFSGKNYFLSNLSNGVGNAFEADGVLGISGKDSSRSDFIFIGEYEDRRQSAYMYDDALKIDYGGKYYFPTVNQFAEGKSGAVSYPGITDRQYGDWQVPFLDSLDFDFINNDRLYLKIDPQKINEKIAKDPSGTSRYVTMSLTGDVSSADEDKSVVYLVSMEYLFEGSSADVPFIAKQGHIEIEDDPETGRPMRTILWDNTTKDSVQNPITMTLDGEEKVIAVLDDITSETEHFAKLFDGTDLIPGENITIRMALGEASGDELFEVGSATENSLFAYSGGTGTNKSGPVSGQAGLKYIRHIENLDPLISNVDSGVTKAYLLNSQDWESQVFTYDTIYTWEGDQQTPKEMFYGIYNPDLTLFDGENRAAGRKQTDFTLSNIPFWGTDFGDGKTGAGLFRHVGSDLTVRKLKLTHCHAESASNAGTLIAEIGSGAEVSVDSVLAVSRDGAGAVTEPDVVSTGAAAGGLIGAAGGDSLTIENSAASLLVEAKGAAGGLIGKQTAGDLEISESYVGGHTDYGTMCYSTTDWNIYSEESHAGGVIGLAEGSGSLTMTDSFSAASVCSDAAGSDVGAGGLVGKLDNSAELNCTYVIAPVKNVPIVSTANTVGGGGRGAFVGVMSGSLTAGEDEKSYYLPEVYAGYERETNHVARFGTVSGSSDISIDLVYYERDGVANAVSAKQQTRTMEILTASYDSKLSTHEYPYSVWTNLMFNQTRPKTSSRTFGTYYGDWQPIETPETVARKVTFSYIDPHSGAEISLTNKPLGTQELIKGRDNSILVPGTTYYPGYTIKWKIDGESGYRTESGGRITINADETEVNRHVTGTYVKTDASICSVTFKYNREGRIGYTYQDENDDERDVVYESIGAPKMVTAGTSWGDFYYPAGQSSPVKARTINDYRFIGWYYDKACEYPVENSDTIDDDIVVYAKYEKLEFYTITIDFLYEIEEEGGGYGSQHQITSVPRYSLDDMPQYRIIQPRGWAYSGSVTLPSVDDLDAASATILVATEEDKAHAWCGTDSGGNRLYEAEVQNNTAYLYAEDNAHFQVVFRIPAEKAAVDVGFYRFVYIYDHTQTNSASRAYHATQTRKEYPFGEDAFFPLELEADGDPIIPTVEFETVAHYLLDSTQDSLRAYDIPSRTVTVGEGDKEHEIRYFDLEVHYTRRKHKLYFDTSGGSPIPTVELYYGETVSQTILTGKTTTRSGYPSYSWSAPYRKGDADRTELGWGIPMPDGNLEVKASWVRENIPYTVIFWRQKVSDDRDAPDAEKTYDFVASVQRTVRNLGDTATLTAADKGYGGSNATGEYQGFHFNEDKSDTGNIVIRADGSTVLNAYYDRNMLYMKFADSYPYTPPAGHDGDTIDGYQADGTTSVTLTYREAEGKWMYRPNVTETVYENPVDSGYTKFYQTTTSGSGTQYANDGILLYKSGTRWYRSDTQKQYSGTRYAETTIADTLTSGSRFTILSGTMQQITVPNNKILKKENGRYYYYDIRTYTHPGEWTEGVIKTNMYRGLYGQPITKYGYTWPTGYYQNGTYYPEVNKSNPSNYTGSGTGRTDSSTLTYLGQFKFPDQYINCLFVQFSKGSSATGKIYFVKQNEDGGWPSDYTKVPDVGNMSSSSTGFNFTNKFDGYEVCAYTVSSSGTTTTWRTASNGGSSNERTYAVRFERKIFEIVVNIGYIDASEGIVYPGMGASSEFDAYTTTTSNSGTQYASDGTQLTYSSGRWRKNGTSYTGTRYAKLTAVSYGANAAYYTLENGAMVKHTVPSGSVLERQSNGKYVLRDQSVNPADYTRSIERRYDTAVTTTDLNGMSIPDAMTINGNAGYQWDGKFWMDDQGQNEFRDGVTHRVPTATLQYFVIYTPPAHQVSFSLRAPEDAESGVTPAFTGTAPTVGDIRCQTDASDPHTLNILHGFSLDGYVTNSNGDFLPGFTPACEGYEFVEWVYEENGVEKSYYTSLPIEGDLTLYPKWEKIEVEEREQSRVVRVHHLDKDSGESVLPDEERERYGQDYQIFTVPCGKTADFFSLNLTEYYAINSVKQQYIQFYDTETDKGWIDVTFYYKKVTTWKYQVEYRAQFRSYESVLREDNTPDPALSDYSIEPIPAPDELLVSYPIGEAEIRPAYSQHQSVVFSLPEELGAYNLAYIVFEKLDENGDPIVTKVEDNTYVVIDRGAIPYPDEDPDSDDNEIVDAKVTFYLEPDPTAVSVGDRFEIYSGEEPERSVTTAEDMDRYAAPDGYELTVKDVYGYYDDGGHALTNVKEVGSCKMDGFILLELKKTGSAEKKTFLLYKDISRTLNLRIDYRPVMLISASETRAFTVDENDEPQPLIRSTFSSPGVLKDSASLSEMWKTALQNAGMTAQHYAVLDCGDILIVGQEITAQCPLQKAKPFVQSDGVTIAFSVEAFRLNPGSAANTFAYSVANDDMLTRYRFKTAFGTLKVT